MNELSFNLRSPCTLRHFVLCFAPFHRVKCHRLCAHLPQTMHLFTITHFTLHYQQHCHPQLPFKQPPPFSRLTTPLPLRGGAEERLKGAGVSALFPSHHFIFNYQQRYHPQLPFKQPPPFPWLTTPLSLRRGAGGEARFPYIISSLIINNITTSF